MKKSISFYLCIILLSLSSLTFLFMFTNQNISILYLQIFLCFVCPFIIWLCSIIAKKHNNFQKNDKYKYTKELKIFMITSWVVYAYGFIGSIAYQSMINESPDMIIPYIIFTCFTFLSVIYLCAHPFLNNYFGSNKYLGNEKTRNKYEKTELKKISLLVDKLFQNTRVENILNNHLKQSDLLINYGEFIACVSSSETIYWCKPKFSNYMLDKQNRISSIDNIKSILQLCNNCYKDNLFQFKAIQLIKDNNEKLVNEAYAKSSNTNLTKSNAYFIYNYFYQYKDEINRLTELYKLLTAEKVLEASEESESAFYIYTILKIINDIKFRDNENNEKYNISDSQTYDEIIESLYANDELEETIVSVIANKIYLKRHNENILFCTCIEQAKLIVNSKFENFRQKEKLKRLESGIVESRISISDIDLMSGEEFEHFVANLFENLGYNTSITKLSGDQGIDVIAKKGTTMVAIQAKCYSHPVGNHAVMEAFSGAKYYNADKCMVITNNIFTKSAQELAKSNNVVLWDRKVLIEKLKEI